MSAFIILTISNCLTQISEMPVHGFNFPWAQNSNKSLGFFQYESGGLYGGNYLDENK